jgi:glycosyltransferase involved in cell wall biosynthesis
MKKISFVTPCYNEEGNVEPLAEAILEQMRAFPQYSYDHIYIDNCSTDGTEQKLRRLAAEDKKIKVILNARNFGHIRSPFHGLLQADGDAVVYMVSDFQDPPELIPKLIKLWEGGAKAVLGIKDTSDESGVMFFLRKLYYRLVEKLADVATYQNFTGFGLYDRKIVDYCRELHDPYPYFRGIIAEVGLPVEEIHYHQPKRPRGITKNNFYTLYDMAMLGITNHSKIPLRLATMSGFVMSLMSLLAGLGYFVLKLLLWKQFPIGIAPLVIGLFLFASVQLLFIGILGEYVAKIYLESKRRPRFFIEKAV